MPAVEIRTWYNVYLSISSLDVRALVAGSRKSSAEDGVRGLRSVLGTGSPRLMSRISRREVALVKLVVELS